MHNWRCLTDTTLRTMFLNWQVKCYLIDITKLAHISTVLYNKKQHDMSRAILDLALIVGYYVLSVNAIALFEPVIISTFPYKHSFKDKMGTITTLIGTLTVNDTHSV